MSYTPLLKWDAEGERFYETGVDNCILFPWDSSKTPVGYGDGVAWNGITSINESPSGAEASAQYADNIKYLNLISNEDFGATIEAFTYPDEFAACDGSADGNVMGLMVHQQARKKFGLFFRTRVGNDTEGDSLGYKYHFIYNCIAAPSERSYATVNDSPEAMTLSWEITTTPVEDMPDGFRPTAHITIDSSKLDTIAAGYLDNLLQIVYGKPATKDPVAAEVKAKLPLPKEVITIMQTGANG